jgi:hypothetical protein
MTLTTPTPDHPTTSPTRFRRTRIAVSVVFGVVTLLLMMMWVRSYWRADVVGVQVTRTRNIVFASDSGQIHCALIKWFSQSKRTIFVWKVVWNIADPKSGFADIQHLVDSFGIVDARCPYWISMAIAFGGVVAPWIPLSQRFTLRTLFIATTLVAAILGLVAWTRS